MLYKFFQLIVERPRNTLSIVAGITLLSILFIPNIKIDFSIEHLFSEKGPMVERYSSFLDTFGREDNIITIIYKPSDHLERKLYVELEDLVYQKQYLDIKFGGGRKSNPELLKINSMHSWGANW